VGWHAGSANPDRVSIWTCTLPQRKKGGLI